MSGSARHADERVPLTRHGEQGVPLTRHFGASAYAHLKTLTRGLIEACGGVDGAAAATRLARTHLHRARDPHEANFLPVDVAMDLMAASGDVRLLAGLADHCGHLVIPKLAPLDGAAWHVRLAEVGREVSDVFAAFAAMAADARHDPAELVKLREEALAAVQQLGAVIAAVNGELDEGGAA